MSDANEVKGEEKEISAAKGCEISGFRFDAAKLTVNANVKLTGRIQQGKGNDVKWTIPDAIARVTLKDVPVHSIIKIVMERWFWVRNVQDKLRKGSRSDALAYLKDHTYDWTETLARTREAVKLSPEAMGKKAIDSIEDLEVLERLQAEAAAKIAALKAKGQ